VDQIIDLVRHQIEDANAESTLNTINRIILVGGFGDSEYLRAAFKRSFSSDAKIVVTVPDKPQAAIVQGAALRGLEGLRPMTRRCRRHYGFTLGLTFRYGIDSEAHSYIDSFTNEKMVRGIMKWMIAKVRLIPLDFHSCLPSNFHIQREKNTLSIIRIAYPFYLRIIPEIV